MKKTRLGLSTLTILPITIAPIMSCSTGIGSVIKSKINSTEEAIRDLKKIQAELITSKELKSDVLGYSSFFTTGDLNEKVITLGGFEKSNFDKLEISDSQWSQTEFIEGEHVHGYEDWTGSHGWRISSTEIQINKESGYLFVLYRYDKTNGVWVSGKKTAAWTAIAAIDNAIHEWKHTIDCLLFVKGSNKDGYKDYFRNYIDGVNY